MAEEMTTRSRLSVLLVSTPVLAFIVVGGLIGNASAKNDQVFQHLRVFEDVVSLVMNKYVEDVEVDRVMEGAMRGLADGLDPDSAYLTAPMVQGLENGKASGANGEVGLELTRQYYLRVIAARDGSAAAKAGLQTGDYVRAIDGRATRDMSVFEGSRLLRGAPGSKVTLTVIRGNAAEPHDIALVREPPAPVPVTSRMVGTDLGYIRIPAFNDGTVDGLKKHAGDLGKAGARALVIDLRRTAEGSLDQGIAAARLFVKSGTIAVKAGREADSSRETVTAAAGDGSIELPVTLVVSNGTSGAAELFAAALDGNKRADLVGERTLGRAGVQKLVKLPEGRGLWLTHAKYLTVSGDPLHGRGLEPDVKAEEPDVDFGAPPADTDPVLDAAVAHARGAK
jgi:carboxyl-terminal processing protease